MTADKGSSQRGRRSAPRWLAEAPPCRWDGAKATEDGGGEGQRQHEHRPYVAPESNGAINMASYAAPTIKPRTQSMHVG